MFVLYLLFFNGSAVSERIVSQQTRSDLRELLLCRVRVSAIDSNGRTIWIADAHRGDGKRFVVHADERLSAFLEVETVIRPYSRHAKYEFNLSHARTDPHPTPQRDDGPHALYCGERPRVDEQRIE
jgi:hypothetical protein